MINRMLHRLPETVEDLLDGMIQYWIISRVIGITSICRRQQIAMTLSRKAKSMSIGQS